VMLIAEEFWRGVRDGGGWRVGCEMGGRVSD